MTESALHSPISSPRTQRSTRIRPFGLADGIDLLITRLNALAPLAAQDHDLLRRLPGPLENLCTAQTLDPALPRFLISGWACRYRMLSDGRRQIFAVVLPGDSIGLSERGRPLGQCGVITMTPCRTIGASSFLMASANPAHNALKRAQEAASALEASFLLDQIVRLGRQTAMERLAHLLLELQWRLAQVGLTHERQFPLPLTQEVLADTTGLSIVHVNRTLQQMRRERLIELRHSMVTLLEPEQLARIADYRAPDPMQWTEPALEA
ncbi:MAG: helix-turn-helix domain-containing protein [Terricaulis sp.]